MVDISEKCGHNGGNRPSSYGKDGGKAELCAEHAADSIWWMPAARDVTIAGASSARSTARPVGRWGSALTMPQTAWRASSARDVAQGVRASSDHHTARLVAELCAEHAEYGMLDVRNPVCDHSLCAKQPSYGEAGAERAKGNMVNDVVHRRCAHHGGCNKRPSYDAAGSRKRETCAPHAKQRASWFNRR